MRQKSLVRSRIALWRVNMKRGQNEKKESAEIQILALYPKDLFPVNKLDTIISFKDNQKDGKCRLFG